MRNADPANKGQVQNPTLNIQMNNFTDTMPEIQSGIVTSIEENMSNKTVDSAIPEPDTIVA